MTIRQSPNRRKIRWVISLLVAAACLSAWVPRIDAEGTSSPPAYGFEIYLDVDGFGMWIGDTIRYTVYESSVVEARILSTSGEIILLYRLGTQAPGQYTLPWDGTYEGSPMFGLYRFELYFGDEYAAENMMTVNLRPPSS